MRFLFITLRIFVFAVLAALLASFITSNTAEVTLSLFPLPFVMDLPLYALGLGMLCFGFLAGGAVVSLTHAAQDIKRGRKRRLRERKLKATEEELNNLRLERGRHPPPQPAQTLLPPSAKRGNHAS